jgi:hypothetical protein
LERDLTNAYLWLSAMTPGKLVQNAETRAGRERIVFAGRQERGKYYAADVVALPSLQGVCNVVESLAAVYSSRRPGGGRCKLLTSAPVGVVDRR